MKKTTKKTPAGTVDCTPKWEGVLPILLATSDIPSSQTELQRMARLADAYNDLVAADKPEALRKAGVDAVALLESTDRGRRVLDAVQWLFSTYGAGGYGLDVPGMQALVAVIRAASAACFTGVIQKVPSESRVHEEYRLARGSADTIKFRIRRADNMHWLIEYESNSVANCLFGSSISDAMRMPLHQAISRRAVLESHGVPVEILAE